VGQTAGRRSGSLGSVGGKAGAESVCRPPGENVEGRTFLTLLGFLVVEEVQFFQCGLEGKDRPEAPSECLQCGGKCRFHRHGSYERYGGVSGEERVKVMRFLCPRCGRTWSVIPSGMLPYWSLEVARLERHLDEESELAGEGARPRPPPRLSEDASGGHTKDCRNARTFSAGCWDNRCRCWRTTVSVAFGGPCESSARWRRSYVSFRTIETWWYDYTSRGYQGLTGKSARADACKSRSIDEELDLWLLDAVAKSPNTPLSVLYRHWDEHYRPHSSRGRQC
jgi:hypothetical protein